MISFERGPGSVGLDPQSFRALAGFLERMADDVARRAETRGQVVDEAQRVGVAVREAWRSPVAETMADGFSSFASSAAGVGDRARRSLDALRELAAEARRVGEVIAEVEPYEKSWNEQLVSDWSEWQDRTTTALAAALPGGDDERSAELTGMYQERTRRAQEASARRHEALTQWQSACERAAAAVRAAIDELDGFATAPPPPALAQPEETTVGRLSDGEFDALMRAAPDEQRRRLGELRGRFRAEETERALRAVGLDPERFRPEDLGRLDPSSDAYRALLDLLEGNAGRMDDAAFAAGYYDALGVEGIRATLGALEMMQFHQRHGVDGEGRPVPELGDRIERTITAHVSGFAAATRAPELADDLPALLDAGNSWQLHQLAILASGPPGSYDPRFLGDAAHRILVTGAEENRASASSIASSEPYPPVHSRYPLYSDDRLNLNEAIALHAVAGSPAVAWAFVWDGESVRDDALATLILLRTRDGRAFDDTMLAVDRGGAPPVERMGALVETMRRDSLAAIDHVLAGAEDAGVARHEDGVKVHSSAMTIIGDGGASGPVKHRVATYFNRYLEDMHQVVSDQEQSEGEARGLFDRPDMVRFFAESLADPYAAKALGFHLTGYAKAASQDFLEPGNATRYAEAQGRLNSVARIGGALLDGAEVSKERTEEALENASQGAHAALDTAVEGVLLFLPGGFGPPAEVIKTYGHGMIDSNAEVPSNGDPAGILLHDMRNSVETAFADRVRNLTVTDQGSASLPRSSEDVVNWWFESRGRDNPIRALGSNMTHERGWYADNEHWDKRPEEER